MLASLIVIALVAAAFVATFIASTTAGNWNERRTAANQLAQQRMESVVAQPWSNVGLIPVNAGYRATAPNGESTVSLSIGPYATSIPLPLDSVVMRGTTYAVRTDVTWRDDAGDGIGVADRNGNTQDIKHVAISVQWSLGSRSATVSFDGLRGANAVDVPPAGLASAIAVAVTAPATQLLTSAGLLSTAMTINATTSRATNSATLSFSTRAGRQTAMMTSPNGGTSWTVTLPTTTGAFDTGSQTFSVTAVAGTASGSNSAQVNLAASAATVTVSAAPSQQLGALNVLTSQITVQVTSPLPMTGGTVSYPTASAGTQTRPLGGSGTSWSYVVPADSTAYSVGNETFSVSVTLAGGSTATGTGSISLVDPNLPPDVTSVVVNDPYSATSPYQSFCISSSNRTLFTVTYVDAKVLNVATTDSVQLNAPNYTGTNYYAMTYQSTSAVDNSKTFRLAVAAGTPFPSGISSVQLKVQASKTISGTRVTDDLFVTVPLQVVSKSTSCA